jgi:energy-coupling factor transport system substrate-specific component
VLSAPPTPVGTDARGGGLALRLRPALVLALASVAGLAMFLWPLLLTPSDGLSHVSDAPYLFALVLPVVIAVVLAELHAGGIETKAMAMLGVLAAIGAALRPTGAGVAGVETVFFLLVLAGRVYGPGFGFVLGNVTLLASAVLTGGIGPWLPFQMLAAGWVGLGAGLLPRSVGGREVRGWTEIALLAAYGAFAAYAFGFLMNMWFWPYSIGTGTDLSYVAGDAVVSNLRRFVLFTFATSTFGWDTGRAITNVVAIVLVGPAVLFALRRAARRAAFDAPVELDDAPVA